MRTAIALRLGIAAALSLATFTVEFTHLSCGPGERVIP